MKTSIVILMVFFGLNVLGQNNVLPQSLKKMPSLTLNDFSDFCGKNYFIPFHADSLSRYSFIKPESLLIKNKMKQKPALYSLAEPEYNMPVLNPKLMGDAWNMPVAVPDSTVEFYIKNSMSFPNLQE